MSESITIFIDPDFLTEDMGNAGAEIRAFVKQYGLCELTVKKPKSIKSSQQRAYAHKCLQVIANYAGDTMMDLKLRIKVAVGLFVEKWASGRVVTIEISTEDLTKSEYSEFIEAILMTGEHLDLKMPKPADIGIHKWTF